MPMMINLIASGGGMFKTGMIISLVMFLIALPLTIFLSGVLRAYVLTSWTLTYRRMAEKTEMEPEVISLPEKKK
jgi:hypothetical protein